MSDRAACMQCHRLTGHASFCPRTRDEDASADSDERARYYTASGDRDGERNLLLVVIGLLVATIYAAVRWVIRR